jgi:ferredoxin, 2Fe-2S
MSKVIISNLDNRSINIILPEESLLRNLQEVYLDWMHACGGKGRCTTCKTTILEGYEHISSLSKAEIKYKNIGKLLESQRLACQIYVAGDITIEVPDESKLPHVTYSY